MPRLHLCDQILEQAQNGEVFELDADSSKKIARVLRMTAGETFVGFGGGGREWECVLVSIQDVGKARAQAQILHEREVGFMPRVLLSVAQAVPKGDKMDLVLQKGTELGVREFWPFEAERSVARLDFESDATRSAVRAERWRRIVEGAAAQCGRADVPIVHAIGDLAGAVDFGTSNGRCFLLDESDEALSLRLALQQEPIIYDDESPPRVMLLVGPEGGWSPREREWALRYGAESVHLGFRILRTETAALVATAIFAWEAGEL